jgi:hypothetical protein
LKTDLKKKIARLGSFRAFFALSPMMALRPAESQ